MIVLSGLIALVGVVGAIAVILGLTVLAESWLTPEEPPSDTTGYDRPLVRIIRQGPDRRAPTA